MILANVIKSLRGKRFAITGRPNYGIDLFPGQKVFLNREPLNKYDPNAIAVFNTSSKVVGHFEKERRCLNCTTY
eukprot:UN01799